MKNELWIIIPTQVLVRKDTIGLHPETGADHVFPYSQRFVTILKGYHPKTHKFLHEYGPFPSLPALEAFAKEHQINLTMEEHS